MAHPAWRWWTALAAVALAGCLPREVPIVGSACDDEHLCGGGLYCVAGICSEEAAPGTTVDAGLLPNGDFEKGLEGWRSGEATAVTIQQEVSRSGNAAKVELAGLDDYFSLVLERTVIGSVQSGQTYCAEAWVQRGTTRRPLTLIVRGFAATSGNEDSSGDHPTARVTPMDDQWHRIANQLKLTPPNDAALNLRIFTPRVDNGSTFYVDDVRVWVDPTGTCAPAE